MACRDGPARRERERDLLISCARGTRALRRMGGEQPNRPSCSLRPHDQNVLPQCAQGRTVCLLPLRQGRENRSEGARPMRAVKGSLGHFPREWREEMETHRWTRAVGDQSAPIPRERTSELGEMEGAARCPFCSQNAHDKLCSRGLLARLGVPVCGRVRQCAN